MFDFIRRSMMARLTAVAAVALFTMGAQKSCSFGDKGLIGEVGDPESGNGPTFTTTLVLKDAAGNTKTTFREGDVITLQLTVRNRTSQPVELDFVNGQQYDFFVFSSGSNSVSWLWSSTALFTQAESQLTFTAGESKVFTVSWAPNVARGAYEARGALIFDGLGADRQAPHELGSTLVAFTVE
jgi:hypothetical protein